MLPTAAPGFDDPLGMLAACHRRIEQACETLTRLPAHLSRHGTDAALCEAAAAVLRYFDTAAVDHHDDEERNLFPLLERAQPNRSCDLVETLTLEHEEQARLWRVLRAQLAALAQGGNGLDAALVARFVAANREHLAFEDAHVLPLAARVLDAHDLSRLGRAMAARRGLPLPR